MLRAVVVVVGAFTFSSGGALAQSMGSVQVCPGLEFGPARTVARVISAETVALDDGVELRLMGALAPRAEDVGSKPGQWPPEVAAVAELTALVLGKSIELGFSGERVDRHGRLQAQAYILDGSEWRWIQGHLLAQGLARAYTLAGNRACGTELLAAEEAARNSHRGLWAEAAYHVRAADNAAELLSYRATFQVVEAKIARVTHTRGGVIYLNFAADWRKALSIALQRRDRPLLGDFARNPRDLEGKTVRVRGWIEQRGRGPLVDLSAAGNMTVVAGQDDGAGPLRRGGQAGAVRP